MFSLQKFQLVIYLRLRAREICYCWKNKLNSCIDLGELFFYHTILFLEFIIKKGKSCPGNGEINIIFTRFPPFYQYFLYTLSESAGRIFPKFLNADSKFWSPN